MIPLLLFVLSLLLTSSLLIEKAVAGINPLTGRHLITPHHDLSMGDLEALFDKVTVPTKGNFLHRSIRFKKYHHVKENIHDVKNHLRNFKTRTFEQNKNIQSMLGILYDKILWIDNFKMAALRHFSSPHYANEFFKKHDSVIEKEATGHERK